MNEKRKGKKKYETKDKTFLNELMIVRSVTVKRTLEKSRDASPASEILHSTCERDGSRGAPRIMFLMAPTRLK
jgi:hypothetical protein